jgi:TPR repeat protein
MDADALARLHFNHCRQTASLGSAGAQDSLGHCYEHGKGVVQDWVEAVRYHRLAAAQGESDLAQYRIEMVVEQSRGLAQPVQRAPHAHDAHARGGHVRKRLAHEVAEL